MSKNDFLKWEIVMLRGSLAEVTKYHALSCLEREKLINSLHCSRVATEPVKRLASELFSIACLGVSISLMAQWRTNRSYTVHTASLNRSI